MYLSLNFTTLFSFCFPCHYSLLNIQDINKIQSLSSWRLLHVPPRCLWARQDKVLVTKNWSSFLTQIWVYWFFFFFLTEMKMSKTSFGHLRCRQVRKRWDSLQIKKKPPTSQTQCLLITSISWCVQEFRHCAGALKKCWIQRFRNAKMHKLRTTLVLEMGESAMRSTPGSSGLRRNHPGW